MSEIPSDFFNKKSFNSLPKLAFLTWFIVFIIDAIVLQRMHYTFTRVIYVWIIGFAISFLFELGRYKNMNNIQKSDYKKYFLFLNAFIIFMYASSYTGLTKEIGSWGEMQETLGMKSNKDETESMKLLPEKQVFFLATVEWAIPVFAKQTSYFPDIAVVVENNDLREENKNIKYQLRNFDSSQYQNRISELEIENNELEKKANEFKHVDTLDYVITIERLREKVLDLESRLASIKPTDCSRYIDSVIILKNTNASLMSQKNILLGRIDESNNIVSRLIDLRFDKCSQQFQRNQVAKFYSDCKPLKDFDDLFKKLRAIDKGL